MALLDMADNRWRSQMVADLRGNEAQPPQLAVPSKGGLKIR